jgi:hypothetical protein
MARNQHATTEELLEAAFSAVSAEAVAMERHGKHVSATTVELQQKSCVSYVVRTGGL